MSSIIQFHHFLFDTLFLDFDYRRLDSMRYLQTLTHRRVGCVILLEHVSLVYSYVPVHDCVEASVVSTHRRVYRQYIGHHCTFPFHRYLFFLPSDLSYRRFKETRIFYLRPSGFTKNYSIVIACSAMPRSRVDCVAYQTKLRLVIP